MTFVGPPEGLAPPKQRRRPNERTSARPASSAIFSADNHVSVSEDIFYERFPAAMKDRAPRIWFDDGVWHLGFDGSSFLRPAFLAPMRLFDEVPGSASGAIDQRLADLDAEGIQAELAFPNAMQALWAHPDLAVRELCFRIYNDYLAELHQRSNGRLHGVALVNWWDPKGVRAGLEEAKALGLRTFLLPLKCWGADARPIDWTGAAADPIWDEIAAAGLPVSHHIGETPPRGARGPIGIGFLKNTGSFRAKFAEYVFGGILDRHPDLRIGWFEAGILWAASAIQDARHAFASYRCIGEWDIAHDPAHYWRAHMAASFIDDPLGLDHIGDLGADTVMWSADYPHGEGTIGYTGRILDALAARLPEADFRKVTETNVRRFLGV